MAVTADKPAPYATSRAILDLIDRYRSRGLPLPINEEVLARAGIAETLIPRTIQSLVTLDLIDAETGQPTETFETLRLSPEGEYKKRLEDWLKGTYADVFAFVDPTKDDVTRIRDAFRSYLPIGQQPRMVSLFQGLCAAAGLIAVPPIGPLPSTRPRTFSTVTLKRAASPKPSSNPALLKHASHGLPAPLAGLLASLPAEGDSWTKEAREKFMATFGTVLDFCFPIVKNAPANATKEKGGQA